MHRRVGDVVERHQRHRRHVLVQLRRVGRVDDALRRMTPSAAAGGFLALFSHGLVAACALLSAQPCREEAARLINSSGAWSGVRSCRRAGLPRFREVCMYGRPRPMCRPGGSPRLSADSRAACHVGTLQAAGWRADTAALAEAGSVSVQSERACERPHEVLRATATPPPPPRRKQLT